MAQPTEYEPSYAFIELVSWPGDKLDIELENIKLTTDEIRANLALIQRDDGALVNGIVTPDSFSAESLALMASANWAVRGAWVTATAYAKLDLVTDSGSTYLCAVAHTSGTLATDISAGKWIPIYVVPDTTINDGTITNAKLADMMQATIKGRAGGAGTGAPVDLTATQARAILNVADNANAYVHPNHTGDVTSVADGALTIGSRKVTRAHMELATQGDVLVYGASGAPQSLVAGTAGQFLKTQGAGSNPAWATPAAVQVVSTETGAVATGTTTIPNDDTIPQNTEGDEYMTRAITPTNAANKLKIDVVWNGASSASGGGYITVALFQDSTADALAAVMMLVPGTSVPQTITFSHVMVAGTASATTFKIRAGAHAAATTTFNGYGGARKLGGVIASSIVITEIAA